MIKLAKLEFDEAGMVKKLPAKFNKKGEEVEKSKVAVSGFTIDNTKAAEPILVIEGQAKELLHERAPRVPLELNNGRTYY